MRQNGMKVSPARRPARYQREGSPNVDSPGGGAAPRPPGPPAPASGHPADRFVYNLNHSVGIDLQEIFWAKGENPYRSTLQDRSRRGQIISRHGVPPVHVLRLPVVPRLRQGPQRSPPARESSRSDLPLAIRLRSRSTTIHHRTRCEMWQQSCPERSCHSVR